MSDKLFTGGKLEVRFVLMQTSGISTTYIMERKLKHKVDDVWGNAACSGLLVTFGRVATGPRPKADTLA